MNKKGASIAFVIIIVAILITAVVLYGVISGGETIIGNITNYLIHVIGG